MTSELQQAPQVQVIPGSQFLAAFESLEHAWDGLLPRGRVTCLTAQTGHGKTALGTAIELHVAAGLPFAGRDTIDGGGRVLALVGENPHDKCMRMIAQAQNMGLSPEVLDRVLVIEDTFDIETYLDGIFAIADRYGSFALVTVDTSAAFFTADEENANVAQRRHASMFRQLTKLPGEPAVMVLCHPTKNATKENLEPRGGGAFLAEVDGNLTAWKDDNVITLHHHRKFRGPPFDPIKFELKPVELQGYSDRKGKSIHSVYALHIPDDRAEQLADKALDDENRVLLQLWRKPGAAISDIALKCGWVSGTGAPSKSRVHRTLEKLRIQSLAEKTRTGAWELTPKGKKEAERL